MIYLLNWSGKGGKDIKQRLSLSGFGLKRLAMVSMVIDHIGSILLSAMLIPYRTGDTLVVNGDSPAQLWRIMQGKELCEVLGSIAFPIFCFLMVEGFLHTRDRVGYGLRLALFALISEVPFDLAHFQAPFSLKLQNVMFTLAASIFTLLALRWAEERWREAAGLRWAAVAGITVAGMALAYLLRGEYVFLGVLSVVLVYLLRDKGRLRVAGLAPLLVVSPWVLLAVPPILLYNGERGRGSKWFFYLFYPAHFLVLAALAALARGGA